MSDLFISPDEAQEVWAGEEDPEQYVVVALDPGGESGWCVFCIHPDAMTGDPEIHVFGDYGNVLWWTAGEFNGRENDQCDEIVHLIESWPSARLVSEKFIMRSKVTSAEVFSLERMNAIVGWAIRPRYLVLQQPELAMTTVTDDRQKDMGLWLPGKPHARDAIKHGVTFLKRKKEQAVQEARRIRRSGGAAA